MTSEWLCTTLGDVCEAQGGTVQTGPFGSQLHASDYVAQGTPVVMPINLVDGNINDVGIARITAEKRSTLQRHVLNRGDIVFSRRGDVTRFALVSKREVGWICGTGCLKISLGDTRLVTPEYMACLLELQESKDWLVQHAVGATMPNLNTSILSAIPVRLPDIETQNRTTEILGVLKDRIDNLRQTNATLEAIAQALFKSWFIDFDPVHAKAEGREPEGMDPATAALFPSEFEDSELGLIPKGWNVEGLGKISKNVRDQAKPESLDSSTPYIGLEHMPKKSIALTDQGIAEGLASGKFWYRTNDILFGKLRPYFHKVGVATSEGVCSTDILVVRPISPEWFGYAAMQFSSDAVISYATQLSNGAKMPRTNWTDLAKFRIALPSTNIVGEFDNIVRSMVARIHANIDITRSLAHLRDTILPRLISGKRRLDLNSITSVEG